LEQIDLAVQSFGETLFGTDVDQDFGFKDFLELNFKNISNSMLGCGTQLQTLSNLVGKLTGENVFLKGELLELKKSVSDFQVENRTASAKLISGHSHLEEIMLEENAFLKGEILE